MSPKTERYVRGAIELVHSFSAGVFPGAVLGMWLIRSGVPASHGQSLTDVSKSAPTLWLVLLAVLFLLVTTGLVRVSYYESLVKPENLAYKRRAVLLKHFAFVATLVTCIVLMFKVVPA